MNFLNKEGLSYLIEKIKTIKQDVLVSGTNIKTLNNETILGSGNISIPDASEKVQVPITFSNSNYSGGCLFFPAFRLCFCRIYITGKAFTTGTRYVLATIPTEYKPDFRTALSVEALQDYGEVIRAGISGSGEISLTTGVAKSADDDIYISGVWYVAPN